MGHYVGCDLHSTNTVVAILNENQEHVFVRKFPNDLGLISSALSPYRDSICGVVVESTYNWYWLVDGLRSLGYPLHLAHPTALPQYSGLKYSDDYRDAFFLARLLLLGLLPEGYIYPKEERHVRDLLRKRLFLARQKTSHILSFQSLVSRVTSKRLSGSNVQRLCLEDIEELFQEKGFVLAGQASLSQIISLREEIKSLEKAISGMLSDREEFRLLQTVPGIGNILGMAICLETGSTERFAHVGNYASYCRCVSSGKTSNGKVKASGNRKNGNKYLGWAYMEAANFAIRFNDDFKRFYQRKLSRTNRVIALKAVAHKICRSCYHILKNKEVFNLKRVFC